MWHVAPSAQVFESEADVVPPPVYKRWIAQLAPPEPSTDDGRNLRCFASGWRP
jgi:hypothetical protein